MPDEVVDACFYILALQVEAQGAFNGIARSGLHGGIDFLNGMVNDVLEGLIGGLNAMHHEVQNDHDGLHLDRLNGAELDVHQVAAADSVGKINGKGV